MLTDWDIRINGKNYFTITLLETIMIIKKFLITLFQIQKIGQRINLKQKKHS